MPNEAKDLITENNVSRTYKSNKWLCFQLKNGMTVKLDPNKVSQKTRAMEKALQ